MYSRYLTKENKYLLLKGDAGATGSASPVCFSLPLLDVSCLVQMGADPQETRSRLQKPMDRFRLLGSFQFLSLAVTLLLLLLRVCVCVCSWVVDERQWMDG